MGWYVPNLFCEDVRLTEWLVVVRTGDHTLIGKPTYITTVHLSERVSIGQIAQLTGGEVGNKSPLAVEMYVFPTKFRTRRGAGS